MRDLFVVLLGVILGCFGTLLVWTILERRLEPVPVGLLEPVPAPVATSRKEEEQEARREALTRQLIRRLGEVRGPIRPFIEALDTALFDRDWLRVEVAVEVLKEMEGDLAGRSAPSEEPTGGGDEQEGGGIGGDRLAVQAQQLRLHRTRRALRQGGGEAGRLLRERTPEALTRLMALFEESEGTKRIEAAHALGCWGTAEAVSYLLRIARGDASKERRRAAVAGLACAGTPAAFDGLVRLLETEPEPDVRKAVYEAFLFYPSYVAGSVAPTRRVVERFSAEREEVVRLAAIDTFGRLDLPRAPEVVGALLAILERDDASPKVLRAVLRAFAANFDLTQEAVPEAARVVGDRLLRETDPELIRAEIRVLGTIGSADSLSLLEGYLPGAAEEVQADVRAAVARIRRRLGAR